MLAEEAGHFWREVGTKSVEEERFMKLPGMDLFKSIPEVAVGDPK